MGEGSLNDKKEGIMKSLMKSFWGLCFIVLCFSVTQTAISGQNQTTMFPDKGRYEIIQSQLNPEHTYRLDRFTGNIDRLTMTKEDEHRWEKMLIQGLPEIKYANSARFVLFMSGTDAAQTFLMDSQTGQTWFLTTSKMPKVLGKTTTFLIWKPF